MSLKRSTLSFYLYIHPWWHCFPKQPAPWRRKRKSPPCEYVLDVLQTADLSDCFTDVVRKELRDPRASLTTLQAVLLRRACWAAKASSPEEITAFAIDKSPFYGMMKRTSIAHNELFIQTSLVDANALRYPFMDGFGQNFFLKSW